MVEILSTESDKWNEYLNYFEKDKRDIYFTLEYHKMHEINGDGKAQCFVYREESNIAIYPYMINEINGYELNEKYYDIESVYGYSGPLANNCNESFLKKFEDAFLDYCSKSNIVAEFIRFHPILGNSNIFSKNIETIYNRKTVYLDVENDIESIWKHNISSKNRNMIRKAEKSGLRVIINNDYSTFRNIYKLTMDKVSADSYYYFNEYYFDFIKDYKNFILMNVIFNNMNIASAIFMSYGDYFHYHLAGSIKENLNLAPNNLLLWEAIKLAHNNKARFMHFGGGLLINDNDNLFKFKTSFSNSFADYYIGKRIHNKGVYDYLISQWEQKNNKVAKILLQYKTKI
jgi:lipid II:glycine glycyltransferase (peptidoglycan interpeptide bridge formation enzyme)